MLHIKAFTRGKLCSLIAAGAMLCVGAAPAEATDGHLLHGVGAVNQAMGGAGIGAPVSLLGVFYLNPAGMMAFDGTRIEFSFEMFKPSRKVGSDLPGFGSGETASRSEFTPIPALGWSTKLNNGKWAIGLAGIGIGGFGVDYAASSPSNPNPILFPQPGGFGQVFSSYSLLKFTPAVAWAPVEKLWLGLAANVNWAQLSVMPAAFASPNFDPVTQTAFYPSATATDGAFGFGAQLGLMYMINDMFTIGAAYTSEQFFESFNWNSANANPNLVNFGGPRELEFKLNSPAVLGAGIGVYPLPNVAIAGDFRYIFYESTEGFSVPDTGPFNPDGSVAGFAWENIYTIAIGLQYRPISALGLRAGYNYSQNPIPDEYSFINVPAPALVQHHLTLGLGWKFTRQFEVSLGYYHAFQNSGTGPILNPAVPPGSTVTNELLENSIQLQFTFGTKGEIQ